jgi:polyisoprenoid-binding protein YceI
MNFSTQLKYMAGALLIGTAAVANAQNAYTLTEQGLELKVTGTSSLHDWHMTSAKATGEASMTVNGTQVDVKSLNTKLVATTLKSGKSGLDDNAYKSLKTKEYPNITFQLTSLEQNGGNMTVTGQLTMAGVTRTVTFKGTGAVSANKVSFAGSLKTKLTEFKIDPPTALFGTVKTGDEVGIEVKATYIKK